VEGHPRPLCHDDERGFTLIELMVVVLIIAILIAVGLPTYFGARERANDRAVQANVRNAFTATRIYYNESLRYTAVTADMTAVEPSLTWTTDLLDSSTPARSVHIAVFDVPDTAQTVVVVGRTNSGRCFYLKDVMGGTVAGTYYDRQAAPDGSCPVPDPDTITAANWTS
jgi:type IV pilus assembly protein PilA